MQFNRYTFFSNRTYDYATNDISTVDKSKNFTTIIKSCGFTNEDGSEIDPSTPVLNFKWKYDKNENTACWRRESDAGFCWFKFYPNKLFSDNLDHLFCDKFYGSNYGNHYHSFFFIPLKNNGFIMSSYGTSYPYGTPNPNTPTLNSLTYNATPPDNSLDLQRVTSGLIGFFNNVNNTFNYISKDTPINSASPATSNYYNIRWDKGNDTGRSSILPNIIDYDGRYTDVKQGVCTLIRVPFSNGFLSNLYLVNTAPRQGVYQYKQSSVRREMPNDAYGVDNKFFSFGGRNFYGIGYNMVVELPSN